MTYAAVVLTIHITLVKRVVNHAQQLYKIVVHAVAIKCVLYVMHKVQIISGLGVKPRALALNVEKIVENAHLVKKTQLRLIVMQMVVKMVFIENTVQIQFMYALNAAIRQLLDAIVSEIKNVKLILKLLNVVPKKVFQIIIQHLLIKICII